MAAQRGRRPNGDPVIFGVNQLAKLEMRPAICSLSLRESTGGH
ncbi:hypothetical protein BZL30_8468 [Mycobacterium kansasii]|uniref:Uncharacterized protein n=1 Tax=Mycobacterium kansasii TaxID=1768 RepID=A0A1V3WIL2_MYCKA|nr:hypothetical protein BZL30_8468 [Mycobacterium kansasii]